MAKKEKITTQTQIPTRGVENTSQLLDKLSADFIGLDTTYTLADGQTSRRVYLDSTASTLMMRPALSAMESFLEHYANTHSLLHFSARLATDQYRWAHDRILSFLGADPERYACFFTGSGATAGVNRLARVFRDYRPDRRTALVSLMEHHSNDLPHRKHAQEVIHIPLDSHDGQPGCINLDALEKELETHRKTINYVAVTGVSNVTGIINPIYDVAELAHTYDALVLVDGAQMAAHLPVQISGHDNPLRDIDAFVFSGHKTYVPGSPGVVICRKDILHAIEPEEVGGGMVERVFVDRYLITDRFPDREEAGTPNIPGSIGLATAIDLMDRIGMEAIYREEEDLIEYALDRIQALDGVMIYGETDCSICPRAASISFNILDMDHGLTAAILNDYFNIAVRNECFCAHPYVEDMIRESIQKELIDSGADILSTEMKLKSGMVRASFGLYSTRKDVDALVQALETIVANRKQYASQYSYNQDGVYRHNTFSLNQDKPFSISNYVTNYFQDPPNR